MRCELRFGLSRPTRWSIRVRRVIRVPLVATMESPRPGTLITARLRPATWSASTAIHSLGVGGVCPAGCHSFDDSDCVPACGNDLAEPPEICDPCPTSYEDGNPCTQDALERWPCMQVCAHTAISGCTPCPFPDPWGSMCSGIGINGVSCDGMDVTRLASWLGGLASSTRHAVGSRGAEVLRAVAEATG